METYDFNEIIKSLDNEEINVVNKLNGLIFSLGYVAKITPMGKKKNDWKCEYKKKKDVLCILRISDNQWSIKCKLFNLSKYNDVLENCNKHFIEILLENSGGCGKHGGGCKGPISFSLNGKIFSRCRHSFMFRNLLEEDIENIIKLLECENKYISIKQ